MRRSVRRRDGVLADTVLWVRLDNPGKVAVVMPVALGGPQLRSPRPSANPRCHTRQPAGRSGEPGAVYRPCRRGPGHRLHAAHHRAAQRQRRIACPLQPKPGRAGRAGQLHVSHHSDGALERHTGIAADDPQVQPAAPGRPGVEPDTARPPHRARRIHLALGRPTTESQHRRGLHVAQLVARFRGRTAPPRPRPAPVWRNISR